MSKEKNTKDKNNKLVDSLMALALIAIALLVIVVSSVCSKTLKQKVAYKELIKEYTVIEEGTYDVRKLKVYDNDTKIVYKAELLNGFHDTAKYEIVSYFADNGLPYRYNEETQKIEKITDNNDEAEE